jgi:hypothetical protein
MCIGGDGDMNEEETRVLEGLKGRLEEISDVVDGLIKSNERRPNKTLVYEERRHFESLFKDRISLQLVFSTLLLYAVYRGVAPGLQLSLPIIGELSLQHAIMWVGVFVSAALSQAVFRTYQLVQRTLDEITDRWPADPYPTYVTKVSFWNANHSLLSASFVLTLLLLLLALFGIGHGLDETRLGE